jgi:flavin reductase (DIM6/NTAB) family NADH-FMN oxidoreductase RutF
MLHSVDPKKLNENVFSLIGDQWTLVTAGTKEHCNTMTASWGGLGVLWHKNVATIYIRPQRYTKEFLEANDTFSLSFFTEDWRKALAYCGKVSGRDEDKFAACGFTVATAGETPYVAQARLVLVCRKFYWQDLDPANMGPEALTHYENKDYHRMYIAEITQVLADD